MSRRRRTESLTITTLAALLALLALTQTVALAGSPRPEAQASSHHGAELRTASHTEEHCFSELEQPPYDITSVLLIPHKTEISTKGTYSDVEGCDSWKRLGKRRVQLRQHGHWVDLEGNFWYPTYENKFHKFAFLSFATHGIHEECERGHWQSARVRFINFVKNVKTGKIVAHGEIKDHPVKIEPTHC